MRKINSIHYGGKVLTVGCIVGLVCPTVCWLLNYLLENDIFISIGKILFIVGMIIIVSFFAHLAVELHQDKRIEKHYDAHKNIKVNKESGLYECSNCGNQQVADTDSYCKICGIVFGDEKDMTPQEILDKYKSGEK